MLREESDTGGTGTSPRPSSPGEIFPPAVIPGWDSAFHAELDSTNLEAKRRIAAGHTGKFLLIAESQANGQCRHDRLWESPPGKGIWASFILPAAVPLAWLPQSALVLAVAVREGIYEATRVDLEAKWPNDLLGLRQKCCGLLVETALGTTGETAGKNAPAGVPARAVQLVLGVGINCNHGADDFPPYLQGVAASLSMLAGGKWFSRAAVLLAVARSIDRWFAVWQNQGFSRIRAAWLAHNCTLGETILLPEGYGHSQATAHDMDPSGALVALTDGGDRIRIDSGEILFPDGAGNARGARPSGEKTKKSALSP
ncbi:putative Biotin--(acetyl-CoA-carboxylase) ligase [uncultured delta proteobacterium]|uniref:Putative Biotin--(Acetyl-CoA-carboxylase) ligase n=1 Tax=uncultured delta proteobacterium TaxID=34034 RepID=A0A212KDS2_9DELT|nr:putative Biotin--(acetyl-CoA-carboxylase) ligase [uncultured delta proteobacterium]